MNELVGKWPGVVAEYDGPGRIVRVRIDGITDESTELPEAVFCNPLGDRADYTEIRIEVGDPVWVEFERGDPRFPIIVGYRTPRQGNPVGWRRWRHENIEVTADGEMLLHGGDSTIKLSANGIDISSGGNVRLSAGGALQARASGEMWIGSEGTLRVGTSSPPVVHSPLIQIPIEPPPAWSD